MQFSNWTISFVSFFFRLSVIFVPSYLYWCLSLSFSPPAFPGASQPRGVTIKMLLQSPRPSFSPFALRPLITAREQKNGFSWHSVFGDFHKICRRISKNYPHFQQYSMLCFSLSPLVITFSFHSTLFSSFYAFPPSFLFLITFLLHSYFFFGVAFLIYFLVFIFLPFTTDCSKIDLGTGGPWFETDRVYFFRNISRSGQIVVPIGSHNMITTSPS